MDIDKISYKVRGAIFKVHRALGAGLFEKVYHKALIHELNNLDLEVRSEARIPVTYDGIELDVGFYADLLVEDCILIEIKSVENLSKFHKKQMLNYLRISGYELGYLVNFNVEYLVSKESLVRFVL